MMRQLILPSEVSTKYVSSGKDKMDSQQGRRRLCQVEMDSEVGKGEGRGDDDNNDDGDCAVDSDDNSDDDGNDNCNEGDGNGGLLTSS